MTIHNIAQLADSFLSRLAILPSITPTDMQVFAEVTVLNQPSDMKYHSIHAGKWFNVGDDMEPQAEEQAILQGILERHDHPAYKSCRALLNATYWASVAGKANYWGQILKAETVDTPELFDGYRKTLLMLFYCSLYAADRYYRDVDVQFNYLMGSQAGMWRLEWYTRQEKGIKAGMPTVQMYMSTKDSWKDKQRTMLRSAIAHFIIEQQKSAQNV